MYTIKQAAIRTGVNIPLLRAWERRYGIPFPSRTGSGYRLYDDAAIGAVQRMRALVDAGWAPSQAAQAVLGGTAAEALAGLGRSAVPAASADPVAFPTASKASLVAAAGPDAGPSGRSNAAPPDELAFLNLRFMGAARALDDAAMDAALGEALVVLGVDDGLERFVMPVLVDIGASWARGEMTVAAEHAASNLIGRRLAALYEAAGSPASRIDCVVGLAPGSRHEIGALAFAVACRRAGLRVLYLGADVPIASWIEVGHEHPEAAVVLGAVTAGEADSAAEVISALASAHPDLLTVVGGASRARTATAAEPLLLPDGLRAGAAMLANRLAERSSGRVR